MKSKYRKAPVSRFMHRQFLTATMDELLYSAQQRMAEDRVQVMPVVDQNGLMAGLLTVADINDAYRLLSASPKLAPSA